MYIKFSVYEKSGFMKKIRKLITHIIRFSNKCSDDNVSAIAGQSAFFIMLSFVPFLMFAFAILSFFNIPQGLFNTYVVNILPESVSTVIEDIIQSSYESAVGMALVTIITALWTAGKGVYSVTEGIRIIYKLPNKHNWIVKRIFSMGYTFLMFIVLILALIVLFISKFFEGIIESYLVYLPYSVSVVYWSRYVIMFVLFVLLIAFALKLFLTRRVEDKRYAKFRLQLPGAVLTALIWTLTSEFITIYVDYFGGFSVYGSIATVAIVMIWLYFIMLIFLYCIQFNYIYRDYIYNFSFKTFIKTRSFSKAIGKK